MLARLQLWALTLATSLIAVALLAIGFARWRS